MPWVAPVIMGVTALASGVSAISASRRRRKAEKELENMQTPTYSPNQSILDYYQKALQKYQIQPSDSAEYKLQKQNIMQGTQQALASSKERRLGGAIAQPLVQSQNNALLKAIIAGEQRKDRDLSRLGQASQMKSNEQFKAFSQNELMPFEKKYNLLAMKAAGAAASQNAATQNMYKNLLAGASMYQNLFSGASMYQNSGSQSNSGRSGSNSYGYDYDERV